MVEVVLTGNEITLQQIINVARQGAKVSLSPLAEKNIIRSRRVVDKLVDESRVVYGVTTGFGKFSETFIEKKFTNSLQKNLIVSHAVGAGDFFKDEVVRAAMLLRVNNFANGYSGVRPETVNALIAMLNRGVTPVVPEKGSLGASGDLVPLAHMVLPLLGLGQAKFCGKVYPGAEAMEKAGIPTVELTQKEGLALINGTQFMTAVGALAVYDALDLLKVADIAAAMSFEAQNGITDALDERMHGIRPHKGQIDSARLVAALLKGSRNVTRQGEIRVQDAYSLRCTPQVHGASKDAVNFVKSKVDIEINSVTDNPVIFSDTEEAVSGGNFHGQPVALAFDFLGIALAEIAGGNNLGEKITLVAATKTRTADETYRLSGIYFLKRLYGNLSISALKGERSSLQTTLKSALPFSAISEKSVCTIVTSVCLPPSWILPPVCSKNTVCASAPTCFSERAIVLESSAPIKALKSMV